jgi:hypothetical protein
MGMEIKRLSGECVILLTFTIQKHISLRNSLGKREFGIKKILFAVGAVRLPLN